MRIVLDTAILARGSSGSKCLARDLLFNIVESDHVLLLPNEMLYELAKVLRYPRMLTLHGQRPGFFLASGGRLPAKGRDRDLGRHFSDTSVAVLTPDGSRQEGVLTARGLERIRILESRPVLTTASYDAAEPGCPHG